jgi:predicted DNA-binding protein YlxM (UPF0122 family)
MKRTKEEVMEMYADYKKGVTLREVGEQHGISKQRVEQIFQSYNLDTRIYTKSDLTKEYHERARKQAYANRVVIPLSKLNRMRSTYKTYKAMQEETGHTIRTIHYSEAYWGLERIKRVRNRSLTDNVLRKLYIDEELSASNIARLFKYSRATITKRLSRKRIHKITGERYLQIYSRP